MDSIGHLVCALVSSKWATSTSMGSSNNGLGHSLAVSRSDGAVGDSEREARVLLAPFRDGDGGSGGNEAKQQELHDCRWEQKGCRRAE